MQKKKNLLKNKKIFINTTCETVQIFWNVLDTTSSLTLMCFVNKKYLFQHRFNIRANKLIDYAYFSGRNYQLKKLEIRNEPLISDVPILWNVSDIISWLTLMCLLNKEYWFNDRFNILYSKKPDALGLLRWAQLSIEERV